MTKKPSPLIETLKYLWHLVAGRPSAARDFLDDNVVDQPQDSLQRRAFVRGGCMFPFVYAVDGDPPDGPPAQGVMLNVSGSGMLFVTKRALAVGAALAAGGRIFGREMRFRARVARVEQALGGFESLHAYGARFTSLAEEDRRRIIRAVFSHYRHLRDLGVLGGELK